MDLNKQEEEGHEEPLMQEAIGLHASPKKQKLCEAEHSNTSLMPDSKASRHAVFWSAFTRKTTPRSDSTSRTSGMSVVRSLPSLHVEDSVLETQENRYLLRIYDKCTKEAEAEKTVQGCGASCLPFPYKGEHTCKPSTCLAGAKGDERSFSTTPISAFDDFNQLAKPNDTSAFSAPSSTSGESSLKTSSNGKDSGRLHISLTLENIYQEKLFILDALSYLSSSENLEFYFLNASDMAACIGVGLPHAKAILHNDLSITIQEYFENEVKLENIISSAETHHMVMKVKMDETHAQQNGGVHVPMCVVEEGETLSRLLGVGLNGGTQYVDETYDKREVSWPLLYDIALFVLTNTSEMQCNGYAFGTSSVQGNSMAQRLHGKRDFVHKHGNLKERGGNGDEDGFGCTHNGVEDDDDPPTILKVTVHPRAKCDILDTQVKPYGLDGASIAPKLVFEFQQNHECKRIFIKALTRLELASEMDVLSNNGLFGWYHTGIQISFGCEDTQGHPQSGRVAILRQNSCRILNPISSSKYKVANSRLSSTAHTLSLGGQATAKFNASLLGGVELQGSSGGSRMKEEMTSKCDNMEMVHECICKGFSFRDSSSTESPARANFFLMYPLESFNVWDNREFLQNQGLFSTIEPCIEGTWIPLNGLDASPYLFKVKRSLKLHSRGDTLKDHVIEHKQEYVLPFYVNHAMTHLRSQRSKHIELNGDQQSVPNVLKVGSVY